MLKYIVFIILVTSSTLSYAFDPNLERCEFLFRGEATHSDDVKKLLEVVTSNGAARVCRTHNDQTSFHIASPILKRGDVSYYSLRRVFKDPGTEGLKWSYSPPEDLLHIEHLTIHMQRNAAENVKHNDEGFIQVHGMSVALFRELDKAWGTLTSSKENFVAAATGMSISGALASDFGSLHHALYSQDQDAPRIVSVEFLRGGDRSFPRYELFAVDRSRAWSIEFDFAEAGIQFESVRLMFDNPSLID